MIVDPLQPTRGTPRGTAVEPWRLGAFFAFIARKPLFWDRRISAAAES
ncbi:hypothetical protein FRUB_07234 [Fimbriiglobus ruber]|uniref:Uncharacterized protein n=1 Tax=Fimbriiglobus ruber TaxID=1908690 RepID=A0A225DEN6_9BACT|nr:hypothetical protein FRUB_07234 [Fimbriiglobus ruber]